MEFQILDPKIVKNISWKTHFELAGGVVEPKSNPNSRPFSEGSK